MTDLEYLTANRGITRRLQTLYAREEEIRSAAEYGSHGADPTGDRRPENKRRSRMDEYVAIMETTEHRIHEARRTHAAMLTIILQLPDDLQPFACHYYLDGETLSATARALDLAVRTVYRRREQIKTLLG